MTKVNLETSNERRLLMSKIKSKNTKPEIRLRKALYAIGLRYRINDKKLPGSPDISIKKYKIAIFVDGDFWHGKDWKKRKLKLKNNAEYWINKIERNIQRDLEVNLKLAQLGYVILRFWDIDIYKNLGSCIKEIVDVFEARKHPTFD